jgi:hypothetical protein
MKAVENCEEISHFEKFLYIWKVFVQHRTKKPDLYICYRLTHVPPPVLKFK